MLAPRSSRGAPQVAEAEAAAASDDHPQNEAEDEQEGAQASREEEQVRGRPALEPVRCEPERLAARILRPGSGTVQAARGSQGGSRQGPRGSLQEGAEHGATQDPYTNIGRGTESEHVGPGWRF